MIDVRRRPDAQSPARAFQIKWAQKEPFQLNEGTRSLKLLHDYLRERQMSKARFPGLLGFFIVLLSGDSALGEQQFEPIAFTQNDLNELQEGWAWSKFLYKNVNGGNGLPPGVRPERKQTDINPGAMVVSTEVEEDDLAGLLDGSGKKTPPPDVFPWERNQPNEPSQFAGVHDCPFSPCRHGSGTNEVSRICGMCGKPGTVFVSCAKCFQLSYCVCLRALLL
jgi:hypothetical protein